MNQIVQIKNLRKVFCKGNICVANKINLSIKEGEIFTILGRTAYKELRKILCSSHPLSSNGLYEPIYSSKNRIINLPPHNNGTT